MRASIQRFRDLAIFALTLFIGPLTITLIADVIIQVIKQASVPIWQLITTTLLALLFGFLMLVGYTDRLDRLAVTLEGRLRARRFRKPSVLILNGKIGEMHEVPPRPQITDFTPADWARALAGVTGDWRIEVGPVGERLNPQACQVVVNPFGETYPEENPYEYTTFSKIRRYVESGGVFVNVAGIPFWYCHNPTDFSRVGQLVRAGRLQIEYGSDDATTVAQTPLFASLFPQVSGGPDSTAVQCVQSEIEHENFAGIANAGGDTSAIMFRAYEVGTQDMIPLLRSADPAKWLIGSLQYGEGYFLLMGLDLRGPQNTGFAKAIAAVKAWASYESHGRP